METFRFTAVLPRGEISQIMTHSTDFTLQVFEKTGFTWPELDEIFIEQMLAIVRRSGIFLEKRTISNFVTL